MGTKTAKFENAIGRLGETGYGLQSMYDSTGFGDASIALRFGSGLGVGMNVSFHASTAEAREFARQLVVFADAADKAHAEAQAVAA